VDCEEIECAGVLRWYSEEELCGSKSHLFRIMCLRLKKTHLENDLAQMADEHLKRAIYCEV
jgi:hypothetical protein